MTHLLLMTEATKDLLIVLAIGGVAGLLASLIMPGRGFWADYYHSFGSCRWLAG